MDKLHYYLINIMLFNTVRVLLRISAALNTTGFFRAEKWRKKRDKSSSFIDECTADVIIDKRMSTTIELSTQIERECKPHVKLSTRKKKEIIVDAKNLVVEIANLESSESIKCTN